MTSQDKSKYTKKNSFNKNNRQQQTISDSKLSQYNSMISLITIHTNIFLLGIIDSFSIHKTIRILVNDIQTAHITLQILTANIILLLGSIYLYNKAINPFLNMLNKQMIPSDPSIMEDVLNSNDKIWIIYQSLWLLPICILCYVCSTLWYQDLADSTFKYLRNVPKATPLTKSVGHALYGTLVWASAFIQVKILLVLFPMICLQLKNAIKLFFIGAQSTSNSNILTNIQVLSMLDQLLCLLIDMLNNVSKFLGLFFLCLMYGWYGFDPKWIAEGLDPDSRFRILQRYWAYFVGFGFPYVVLLENTSFFIGFGTFLSIFPFCILLGSILPYAHAYESFSKHDVIELPVFKPAKLWTLYLLKYIDKTYVVAKKNDIKSIPETTSSSKKKVN